MSSHTTFCRHLCRPRPYHPDAYYDALETASRDRIRDAQLKRLSRQLRHVYQHSPFYRAKFDQAGLRLGDIQTWDDVRKIPFTRREELEESQEESPLFGNFACLPPSSGVRYFQTSGTRGTPLHIFFTARDWFGLYRQENVYMACAYGVRPQDTLFVPSHYSLYIAWWAFQTALESLGVATIPGGGQSSETRVKNILEWEATIVCGTPTYMLYLAEVAERMGIDLASRSRVRMVVVGGEPGACIAASKKRLEEAWGAKCYDDYGSTEMGGIGYECVAQEGLHINEAMFLAEVVGPESSGPVPPGQPGELVLSNLCMESMPLIRHRTGDCVNLTEERCACGRTFARAKGGILGRSDDMINIAGINVFPSVIENFVHSVNELANEFQIVLPAQSRPGSRLKIRVEPAVGVGREALRRGIAKLVETVRWRVGLTPEVNGVPVGTLPRSEGKANKIVKEE
ncbi:MAG: phenylacetate--CoA ligase family protein [Candidatus Binatia bacterium]